MVESNREGKPKVIDLMIDAQLEKFAVRNVLSLGRCLSSPVHSKLVEILSQPRRIIYFALGNPDRSLSRKALRWDMQQKKFLDVVELDGNPLSATLDDEYLLLSPNTNLADPSGDVYLDSAFLQVDLFGAECDSFYSPDAELKSSDQFDPNNRYLPEFDPKRDKFYSSLVDERLLDINFLLASSAGVYWYASEYPKLKKDLIDKAKSSPLFFKINQGQVL